MRVATARASLYRCLVRRHLAFGQAFVLLEGLNGAVRSLERDTAECLLQLRTFLPLRTLVTSLLAARIRAERHRRGIVSTAVELLRGALVRRIVSGSASGGIHVSSFEGTVERLVRDRIVVSRDDLLTRAAAGVGADKAPTLAAIAIPTCDRPAALARCLEGFASNQAAHARGRTQLLVVDDSHHPTSTMQVRQAVAEVARRCATTVACVDRADRERFARHLALETGVSLDLVRYGVLGPAGGEVATGATRNAILLMLSGVSFLSVDDDTLCRLSPAAVVRQGCSIDSEFDPRSFSLHDSVEAALAAAPWQDVDALALHSGLLGRSIASTVAANGGWERVVLDRADDDALCDLWQGRGRVAATMTGIVGHSGIAWPTRFLGMDTWQAASTDAAAARYEKGIESQAVAAAVEIATVSKRSYFKATAFALDNRLLLPPFLPVGRSQDVLFGRMLRMCHPDAYLGCLPWMIAHVPLHARRHPRADIVTHTGVELAYLTGDLLEGADLRAYPEDPRARLLCLGEHLRSLAAMPKEELVELARLAFLSRTCARIRRLEAQMAQYVDRERPWAVDTASHLAELRAALLRPEAAVPSDVTAEPPADPWDAVRDLLADFGALLLAWPACVEGAARLRATAGGIPC